MSLNEVSSLAGADQTAAQATLASDRFSIELSPLGLDASTDVVPSERINTIACKYICTSTFLISYNMHNTRQLLVQLKIVPRACDCYICLTA